MQNFLERLLSDISQDSTAVSSGQRGSSGVPSSEVSIDILTHFLLLKVVDSYSQGGLL